jgi:hypothetical protein
MFNNRSKTRSTNDVWGKRPHVDRYGNYGIPDEFDRFEKQQNQTISFDILDKTEMNSDDDDDK